MLSARTALSVALLACGVASAQTVDGYPSRPIRYLVASAPGGIADITARVLGPRLSESLGQPVVIENRTAGGILVGVELVAKAPADGYTLLSATPQVAIAQSMYKRATIDPRKELAPIALVGMIPNVLVVGPRTPAKSVAELVALARANPGKLNYSSTGAGTSVHLAAELLKYQAGVNIVHVPYRGAAAAMTALIAGDVDMLVDSLPPSLPHIRAGRVRALAVTTATRAPQLPEVPTMAEAGFPGVVGRRRRRGDAARDRRAPRVRDPARARQPADRRDLREGGAARALPRREGLRRLLGPRDRQVRRRGEAFGRGGGVRPGR
jgi:tripartite-type tricarboxylate transporter receptor subunit TctC